MSIYIPKAAFQDLASIWLERTPYPWESRGEMLRRFVNWLHDYDFRLTHDFDDILDRNLIRGLMDIKAHQKLVREFKKQNR